MSRTRASGHVTSSRDMRYTEGRYMGELHTRLIRVRDSEKFDIRFRLSHQLLDRPKLGRIHVYRA